MPDSLTPDRDFLESIAEKISAVLDLGDSVFTHEELAQLQELAKRANTSACIACGKVEDLGDFNAMAMTEHLAQCKNHPLHKVAKLADQTLKMIITDCKSFDDIYRMVGNSKDNVYIRIRDIREIIEKRTRQFDDFIAEHPPENYSPIVEKEES